MTSREDHDYEVRNEGSYDLDAAEDDDDPNEPPEACDLCSRSAPSWWYRADAPGREDAVAFKRCWAVCGDCHVLLLSDDGEALSSCMHFDELFTRELLPHFMRIMHVAGQIRLSD